MLDSLKQKELLDNVKVLQKAGKSEEVIAKYYNDFLDTYDTPTPTAPAPTPTGIGNALFPRTSRRMDKNAGMLLYGNAAKSDLLSLPGRTLTSIPESIIPGLQTAGTAVANVFRKDENDKPYEDGFFKTLGEGMREEKGNNFFSDIAVNPSTGAAILAAIPTRGKSIRAAAPGIIARAKASAIRNAPSVIASSAAAAGEQQFENLNQDKDWSAKQLAQDFTFGNIGGYGGIATGSGIAAVGRAAIKKMYPTLIKSSVNSLFKHLKLSGRDRANGFNEDVFIKNKIVGSKPSENLMEVENLIKQNADAIKETINPTTYPTSGIRGSMNTRAVIPEPTVDVLDVITKMSKSDKLTKGFLEEQKSALDEILRRTSEIDPNGQIKLSDISKVKHIISEMRNDFVKPPATEADKILGKTYSAIDDEFKNVIEKNLGADKAKIVTEANKKMSELIPIRTILQNKINSGFEDKIPGLLGSISNKTLSMGNIGSEALLYGIGSTVGIPPGTMTAYNASKGVYEYATPTLAKNAERYALMNDILNGDAPPPDFIKKAMQGENVDLIKLSKDPEFLRYKKAIEAIRSGNKLSSRIGTFGSIAGSDSTVTPDLKDRIKKGTKRYIKNWADNFRMQNFGATRSF